jgi:hypothetical protein
MHNSCILGGYYGQKVTRKGDNMQTEHKILLTSAEVGNLWSAYLNDTFAVCTIGVYLSKVEDTEIRSVLEFAWQLSQAHVKKLKSFFVEEQYPVPDGFSEKLDANFHAPRLFLDDYYLFYIQNIGKIGLEFYTLALANSARLDLCEYFTECLNESVRLLNKATEIMLKKGTFIRAPFIPVPAKVEYVQTQSYLAGIFGHGRPLNAIEINHIYFNLIQNQLGRALLIGYSQVAENEEVRDYFIRGRNIADKHVEIFGSLLSKEYLPSASAWDTLPTESNVAPFSDKLMLFHATTLNSAGITHYGRSLSQSPRTDLADYYIRLTAEVLNFAKDGTDLLIKNGWLEQPPQAADREKLSKG